MDGMESVSGQSGFRHLNVKNRAAVLSKAWEHGSIRGPGEHHSYPSRTPLLRIPHRVSVRRTRAYGRVRPTAGGTLWEVGQFQCLLSPGSLALRTMGRTVSETGRESRKGERSVNISLGSDETQRPHLNRGGLKEMHGYRGTVEAPLSKAGGPSDQTGQAGTRKATWLQ